MSEDSGRQPKESDQIRPYLESVQTNIISSLRKLITDLDSTNKKLITSESVLLKEYTLIGSLATFYAMVAIFFFTGRDIFEAILQSHNPDYTSLLVRSNTYRLAGLYEIFVTGLCATAVFTTKRTIGTRKIRVSTIQIILSVVITIVLLVSWTGIIVFFG